MSWLLSNSSKSIILDVQTSSDVIDGSLTLNSVRYDVEGVYSIVDLQTGRVASVLAFVGSTMPSPGPSLLSASGVITWNGSSPSQIEIELDVANSATGSMTHFADTLAPT